MQRFKDNKKLYVGIIIGLVLLMSVGYAAFSGKLNITGTGHVKGARWSIHYVKDSVKILTDDTDGLTNITGSSVTTPATINTDLNDITFEVAMGIKTKYEFTVDITNDGSYDALVKTVLLTTTKGTNEAVSTYDNTYTDGSVTYTVTYEDGTPIKISDELNTGETKTLKFKAQYIPISDSAPTEDTDYKFSTSVEYTQSSGLPSSETVNVPYRITYIPNGGTIAVTSKYVNRGEAIGTLPTPTKTGLAFQGWYSDEALTDKVDETYIPTGNMNLYAKYGGKYVVTINAENSKSVSADKMYVSVGEPIGSFPTITYKGGFMLDAWYADASYTNKIDTYYVPSSDTTIYAKSKFNETLGTYYLFNNYKFKATGTDGLLLTNNFIGTGTWSEADTKAKAFMTTYGSRLMTAAEANIMSDSERAFSASVDYWWLSDLNEYLSSHYFVYKSGQVTNANPNGGTSDSQSNGIRPVISLSGVSISVTGGSGIVDDPYVITAK